MPASLLAERARLLASRVLNASRPTVDLWLVHDRAELTYALDDGDNNSHGDAGLLLVPIRYDDEGEFEPTRPPPPPPSNAGDSADAVRAHAAAAAAHRRQRALLRDTPHRCVYAVNIDGVEHAFAFNATRGASAVKDAARRWSVALPRPAYTGCVHAADARAATADDDDDAAAAAADRAASCDVARVVRGVVAARARCAEEEKARRQAAAGGAMMAVEYRHTRAAIEAAGLRAGSDKVRPARSSRGTTSALEEYRTIYRSYLEEYRTIYQRGTHISLFA